MDSSPWAGSGDVGSDQKFGPRKELRVPIKAVIQVIREDGVRRFVSENLGLNGLFFKGGDDGLRLGPVRLKIRLPGDEGGDEPIEASGEVVRFEPDAEGKVGRGVRFLELSREARSRIMAAIERFRTKEPEEDA